jgi:hypothetical protein
MCLTEFGRLPALARRARGQRCPETFPFLGFAHYCGWARDGRFIVKHRIQSKRLSRKLTVLRQDAWRLMHTPLAERRRWYSRALLGQHAAQRAFTQRVPTGSPTHLIHLPPVTQPEESAHAPGLVRGTNRGLVFTTTSNHPPLHIASGALRVTSRKNWARESRLPGTVRAEPKGRANRPRSRSGRGARGGFDRLYGRIG